MTYSAHPEAVRIRSWRARNPEKANANRARYRLKHRDRLAADQRERAAANREGELARVLAWQQANPERLAAYQAERVEMKADALEQKAGRARPDACECCGEANKKGKRLAFDHCHDKGHFRGWLCDRCNLALGLVKDSPALLQKLAHYLIEDAMRQPFDPSQIET